MTSPSLAIRDAIYERLNGWAGYNEFRRTPHGAVQPDKLPIMAIYRVDENESRDGDPNAAEPRFLNDVVIAVSVLRASGDPAVLEGRNDDDIDGIKHVLLRDPTFVHFGGAYKAPFGETWEVGQQIYWDYDLKHATSDPDGNATMGFVHSQLSSAGYWRLTGLFEAVTQMRTRHMFPSQGETFFAEARLEITFQFRTDYEPIVEDDYLKMVLQTQQISADPDSPFIKTVIDIAQ